MVKTNKKTPLGNPKVGVKKNVYNWDTSEVHEVPMPVKPKEIKSQKPQKQSSIISILNGNGPNVYKTKKGK
jgi:hypothetical protein